MPQQTEYVKLLESPTLREIQSKINKHHPNYYLGDIIIIHYNKHTRLRPKHRVLYNAILKHGTQQ